jgi:rod shape-determining protein MreC
MENNRDDFIISIRYALLKKGAKQKFSLFFLILLSLSIVTLDKLSFPFMNAGRALINDIIYHVAVISSKPAKIIEYSFKTTGNHFNVYKENQSLIEEIELLKKQKFDNTFMESENKILKSALNYSTDKAPDQIFSISAKVIIDLKSPYLKSILINKGTRSGIKKGMSVFSNDYLLGAIIETNYVTSRVLLLTDLNSKIPVLIENTNVNALLEGTGTKKNLSLTYLPENYLIEPEKIIFTSGKDGYIQSGIPVAKTFLNKKNKVQIKILGDPDQAFIVTITNGQINQ